MLETNLPDRRLGVTDFREHWFNFLQEKERNGEPLHYKDEWYIENSDLGIQPALKYLPRENLPQALCGWVGTTIDTTFFATCAIITSNPFCSAPKLGELLVLLERVSPRIERIIIPLAIELTEQMCPTQHWVLLEYTSKSNQLSIYDSKANRFYEAIKFVFGSFADWLFGTPIAMNHLLPWQKKPFVEWVSYAKQGVLDHQHCGHFTFDLAKKIALNPTLVVKGGILTEFECAKETISEHKAAYISSTPIAVPRPKPSEVNVSDSLGSLGSSFVALSVSPR